MKKYTYHNDPYINIIEIPKAELEQLEFMICKQPRESLENFYKRQEIKPDILINAQFFDMNTGNTIFTVYDDGKAVSYDDRLLKGYGLVGNRDLVYGNINDLKNNNIKDFFSGYPVLVENGKAVKTNIGSELNYNAKRTAIGDSYMNIYIVLVSGVGCKFDKLTKIFTEIGCDHAINLDGGGSSRCLIKGEKFVGGSYSRPVDSVLAFYLKDQTERKIIYRVQTGAFKKIENAEKLLGTVKNTTDDINAGYDRAYIRYINGLYKVQVGAFSKKENAIRVRDDLKTKGINAFVVGVQ